MEQFVDRELEIRTLEKDKRKKNLRLSSSMVGGGWVRRRFSQSL